MTAPAVMTELTTLLFNQFVTWHNQGYASPSPDAVRHAVRARNGAANAIWLETASGSGDTTLLLSTQGRLVVGIERNRDRFQQAVARFPEGSPVRLFHAHSLRALPKLLPQLVGNVNFWLAGHHAAAITAAIARTTEVPAEPGDGEDDVQSILLELAEIGHHLRQYSQVAVMVDGVRFFDPANADYPEFPTLDLLVDWARTNDLMWHVEHDIFIARNF